MLVRFLVNSWAEISLGSFPVGLPPGMSGAAVVHHSGQAQGRREVGAVCRPQTFVDLS